ncbi:hypothetical protein PUR58_00130, partial [Streptomyces sp. JV186]|nr:hypothetical protein [Streptomyces sp. JV186]
NDVDVCREGILVYRVRTDLPSGAGPDEVLDAPPDTAACWGRSDYPDLADAPVPEGETFPVPATTARTAALPARRREWPRPRPGGGASAATGSRERRCEPSPWTQVI